VIRPGRPSRSRWTRNVAKPCSSSKSADSPGFGDFRRDRSSSRNSPPPGGFENLISGRESGRVRGFCSRFQARFRGVPQTHEIGTAALSDGLCPVATGRPGRLIRPQPPRDGPDPTVVLQAATLAAHQATLYISPVGCLGRVRQNPANAHGWPGHSLQETPSEKSGSGLVSHRIRLNSGSWLPDGG
jgi:hypothetical protein